MVSEEIKNKIQAMLNTHKKSDIADEINVSVSTLKRMAKTFGWRFEFKAPRPYKKYSKQLVGQVIKYYEQNGIKKTKSKFPEVRVRSIIERYPRNTYRQIKWSDDQIIEAIRLACFVSLKKQYIHFNRPFAFEGSIKSLWAKKIKCPMSRIHGLPIYIGKYFVNSDCPKTPTKLLHVPSIYIWSDIKDYMIIKNEMFEKLFKTLADFQSWVYNTSNPRKEILAIIKHYD